VNGKTHCITLALRLAVKSADENSVSDLKNNATIYPSSALRCSPRASPSQLNQHH
jgi:hypothetical protein